MQGNGDGIFGHGSIGSNNYDGNDAAAIAPGDFNNDGNEDLALGANPNGPPQLAVSLGNGAGKFRDTSPFGDLSTYPFAITVGDFSRDGNLDLATVTGCCTLSVFLGK